MDGSRVTQCLDSFWFYTNILTCRPTKDELLVDSLTNQYSPMRDFQNPITPFLLNQQHDSQNVENLTPSGHKFDESVRIEKTERRKRSKLRGNGRKGIVGGCDVEEVSGLLRFEEESFEYQSQEKIKMLPIDDDVAMKQHLKSWVYAIACTVK